MFRRIAAAAALMVMFNIAAAQEKPYTIEKVFQGAIAETNVEARTIPDVWDVATKVLFEMKRMDISGDKPSGTINARYPGATIAILLSESAPGTAMSVKWEWASGGKGQFKTPYKLAVQFFDEFFPLLDEALRKK